MLADVGASCDVDVSGARLIKFTNSAVFDLPAAGVVVKIAGSAGIADRIPHVVAVARWLEAADYPAVRLLEGSPQPVEADGHLATVWQRVEPSGPRPTGMDLAALLRRLHELPNPGNLRPWSPLDEARRRIDEADGADDETLAFLAGCCDDLEMRLGRLVPELRPGPIHADAFLGNLIGGPEGPVLCDFDSTSIGPREWDLTPVAVGSLRLDYPDDPQAGFVDCYGFDVTTWSGFPTLRRLRELQLVVSVLPVLRSNAAVRPQWAHRLRSLREGNDERWQPYERAFAT